MKNNRIILIVVILFVLVCVFAAVVNISYMVWKLNNNDPQSEPEVCPQCGSEDHVTHPVDKNCEICDSPFHVTAEHETAKPTCPTCGSTYHTVHPTAKCPTCGSTYHTVHPKAEQPKKEQPKKEQPKQDPAPEQPKQDPAPAPTPGKASEPTPEQPKQEAPECPVCGSTRHTVHPTEATPASEPAQAGCPTCGSTHHTVHPDDKPADAPTI